MANVSVQRYWDSLPDQCEVCGAVNPSIHHIIHVNRQRITKDDMLVVKLCGHCHQTSKDSVHQLGGERQFLAKTGWNLVELAVLRRHDWEVRRGA
jgi:hypothetical protein